MSKQRYDEDLFENPFFITLEKEYKDLFEQATANRWIICIPKFSIVGSVELNEADFQDHILIPVPGEEDECKTVSNHIAVIRQGEIILGEGFKDGKKVNILFEETFYNNNDESYRVCCVSTYFNKDVKEDPSDATAATDLLKPPILYEDCFKILWGPHGASSKVKDQLDKLLHSFCVAYQRFEGEDIPKLVDLVSIQVTDAMQILLRYNSMKHYQLHENSVKMTNLKVAMEMYMMNVLHKHVFSTIKACVKERDAHINKMTRNLAGIHLGQLGVRKEFEENILSAKKEIAKLNEFSTPTRRILCLTRVMTALSKPISGMHDVVMTTDDLLPLLIFLIIKSQIPNWMANLVYMKNFQQEILSQNDEFSFLLANIEAALDYICSGNVKPSKHQVVSRQTSGGFTSTKEKFFQYVRYGDEAAVRLMLKRKQSPDSDIVSRLCHPLCTCDKCTSLIISNKQMSDTISPQTRDDMGRTALHLAAIGGHANLIDILVKNGCLVDGACYLGFTPLHCACQNGFQNIILLLVHFGASISVVDNEGNTPLHLCAKNGHEDCVKAILFLDILKNRLDVNARNDVGDTPLHLAAKWGYEGIVKFLLDTEANPQIRNRKRQTPLSVAQNSDIQRQLEVAILYNPPVIVQHPRTLSVTKKNPPKTLPILDSTERNKKSTKTPEQSGEVDGKPLPRPAVALMDNCSKDMMSPTTPVVVKLDPTDRRLKDKLFKAIKDKDIQLVKFYLGWTDDVEDEESPSSPESVSSPSESPDLCHPLCQCHKCQNIQKKSPGNSLHVDCQNQKGFSPLHVAVLEHNLEALMLFVKKGANVNSQNRDDVTPLHYACFRNNFQMVKVLVSHGANVNHPDSYGEIPLHLACAYSGPAIIIYLIQHFSTVNQANVDGNTPLHKAAARNCQEIVKLLVDHGANPEVWNLKKEAPHHLTKKPEVERILMRKIDDLRNEKLLKFSNLTRDGSSNETVSSPGSESGLEVSPDKKLQEELSDSIRHFDRRAGLKRSQTFDHSKPSLDSQGLKLSLSIQHFDKERSLRHTQTLDRSSARLAPLRHSLSIQQFDTGTLRHVKLVDKSSPLYLLSLISHHSSYSNYADDLTPDSSTRFDFSSVSNDSLPSAPIVPAAATEDDVAHDISEHEVDSATEDEVAHDITEHEVDSATEDDVAHDISEHEVDSATDKANSDHVSEANDNDSNEGKVVAVSGRCDNGHGDSDREAYLNDETSRTNGVENEEISADICDSLNGVTEDRAAIESLNAETSKLGAELVGASDDAIAGANEDIDVEIGSEKSAELGDVCDSSNKEKDSTLQACVPDEGLADPGAEFVEGPNEELLEVSSGILNIIQSVSTGLCNHGTNEELSNLNVDVSKNENFRENLESPVGELCKEVETLVNENGQIKSLKSGAIQKIDPSVSSS